MSNIKMNGEDSFAIRKPGPNPAKWENKVKIYLDQRTAGPSGCGIPTWKEIRIGLRADREKGGKDFEGSPPLG